MQFPTLEATVNALNTCVVSSNVECVSDSDEPIGRRNAAFRNKSRSSGSKKRNNLPAKSKSKRKIISSDEENMDDMLVKKPETNTAEIHRSELTITMDVVEPSKLTGT